MANYNPTDIKEVWKMIPVPGFEKLYEVSNLGRVRRAAPGLRTFTGRILKAPCNSSGYPHLTLSDKGVRRFYLVHQLVALTFFGPCPLGHEINHKDGVKTNNRIDNLEYVTVAENNHHAFRSGLRVPAYGERHSLARLREQDVRDIRQALANGMSQCALGRKYGVHGTTIRNIGLGITWKHVV